MSISLKSVNGHDRKELEELVAFHNAAYGDSRTIEDWEWEYKGIYPESYVFVISKDNDLLIGTQGMIPIYINIQGKRFLSGKEENILISPDYRGTRLFKKLREMAILSCKEKKIGFVWGFTAHAKLWRRILNFTVFENCWYSSMSIINLRSALLPIRDRKSTIGEKSLSYIFVLSLWVFSTILRLVPKFSTKKYIFRQTLGSIHDLELLYERLRKKYPEIIYIDQDEKYLNWRIYGHPHFQYRTFFAYDEDNNLRGLCFFNIHENSGYLTDFTFEEIDAGVFLLKKIFSELQNENIAFLYFIGNIENSLTKITFKLLRRFGSIKERSSTAAFVVRPLSCENEKNTQDIKNWYLSGLWSEGYKF